MRRREKNEEERILLFKFNWENKIEEPKRRRDER